MNKQETSPMEGPLTLTQHAMLVVWGLFAQRIGLIDQVEQVPLSQQTRIHSPQTKVLEFLVAILAGLPHLQDISRAAHPLDQDKAVAEAWGQGSWADYSGVSRTLQHLTVDEAQAMIEVVTAVSQPFIDQETTLALAHTGQLTIDIDLTGREVSSTSSTYPDVAFGHMGDTIELGYQAALVSLHSPTFGRLWLTSTLHPGNTVSSTQAQAMIEAAEARTGLRPRRRTELVAERLVTAEATFKAVATRYENSYEKLKDAQDRAHDIPRELANWQREVHLLEREYAQSGRQPTSHCKLTRARRKVATYTQRLPRVQKALVKAETRLQRDERAWDEADAEVKRLQAHHDQLDAENLANPYPIRVVLRCDSGFASSENIAWIIEMGYDLYTKARSTGVRDKLMAAVTPDSRWERVGGNATMTAWSESTVDDYFRYPVNVALAQYQMGERNKHAVFVHYGDEDTTQNLDGWFHTYNGRQTIEAGIKEGKNVFQMHHLKVRSAPALLLQEHFACFAANFVRFAAPWIAEQQVELAPVNTISVEQVELAPINIASVEQVELAPINMALVKQVKSAPINIASVKHMVQVCAHTSAWVMRQGDVWLLTFTEQSLYAGYSLRFGIGPVQLPLPLSFNMHSCHV